MIPSQGACNTAVAWEVNFAFADGVRLNYRGRKNGFNQDLPMNDLTAFQTRYGKIADHGTAFEGSNGWVLVDRTGLRSSPETMQPIGPNDRQLVRSRDHARNFVDAIKTRGETVCPIEESVRADNLCHLSDIAVRLERKLRWDPKKEQFLGDKEANKRIELRPARKPYAVA